MIAMHPMTCCADPVHLKRGMPLMQDLHACQDEAARGTIVSIMHASPGRRSACPACAAGLQHRCRACSAYRSVCSPAKQRQLLTQTHVLRLLHGCAVCMRRRQDKGLFPVLHVEA